MGDLSNSRGFGDHRYKDSPHFPQSQQALSAMPDVFSEPLQSIDFVLLGSDGIFDKFTNEQIGEFIYKNLGIKDP
jgi:serine/threonine protein phosphatase PrpC